MFDLDAYLERIGLAGRPSLVEYEQSGWRFRVVDDGQELVLQTASGESDWIDVYPCVPQSVPLVDVETSNWFTSTHPRSPFVTGLIVSTHAPAGTRTSLSDWDELALTEQTPTGGAVTSVSRDAIPQLLEARFGLRSFMLNGDGRVIRGVED